MSEEERGDGIGRQVANMGEGGVDASNIGIYLFKYLIHSLVFKV